MSDDHPRTWNRHAKPPPLVCPRDYCFFWVYRDDPAGQCGYPVTRVKIPGEDWKPVICRRLDVTHGTGDYYEPCEPRLEEAGLPWFYFFPNAYTIVDELKADYERESRELWGDGEQDGREQYSNLD